jgi:hypothetical protein
MDLCMLMGPCKLGWPGVALWLASPSWCHCICSRYERSSDDCPRGLKLSRLPAVSRVSSEMFGSEGIKIGAAGAIPLRFKFETPGDTTSRSGGVMLVLGEAIPGVTSGGGGYGYPGVCACDAGKWTGNDVIECAGDMAGNPEFCCGGGGKDCEDVATWGCPVQPAVTGGPGAGCAGGATWD